MARPDYQGALGFELVKLTTTSGDEVHMLRETGAEDRVATLEERVLWDALVETLAALNDAESILRYAPDISTNCMGKKPATTTVAALSKARAVLKSNGWQA